MKTLFACFTPNLDYALGWMVIHSLWQAIAIALIMGVVMIVLRKKPAHVRYWVANTSLVMVLVAAIATFAYYYDFSKEPGEVRFIPEGNPTFVLQNLPADNTVEEAETITSSLNWESFKKYFNNQIPLIVTIWVMGVALFILKLLGGISYVYYLRSRLNFPADEYWMETLDKLRNKAGVKQAVDLVESALTRTPMVVGHLKPMILFPIGAINRLSTTEVEAILAHEIAHVLRKDYIFNIIQSVIEALFYYHPAVWWISANIRTERENCCDDVAIAICGNSMDYAKALVTVQEMAYYPMMMQPALGFAGDRKNQLLYRVQRILNQPQNKSNVMEKLIATCALVLVMIGLSFGENNFNKKNDSTPSVEEAVLTENTRNIAAKKATFYLFFPEKVDSLQVPKDVKDGTYNYEDNLQTAQLVVKDHYVVSLKVNDIDLKDEQLPNYKKLIDKILRGATPPNSNAPNTDMASAAFEQAGIAFNENGMTLNNPNANMSVDKNGLHLNSVDENGKTFSLSVDENGFNMNTYDDNGQPVTSTIGRNTIVVDGQKNATYIKDGIVTSFDKKGDKWVIKPQKEGIKYIEHFDRNGKLIEKIKMQNGKTYINDKPATEDELRKRGWEVTDSGIQRIGGFQNIQPHPSHIAVAEEEDDDDFDDQKTALIDEMKDLRQEIKECECTTNFDFRMGLINRINNILEDVRKVKTSSKLEEFELSFLKVRNDWESGECEDFKQNNRNNKGNSYLDERVKSIAKRAQDLKYAIDRSNVNRKDPKWVNWATIRLNAEHSLAKNNKDEFGLSQIENEMNIIENQLERLKRQDGKSDCQGCPPGNGQSTNVYSTSPGAYSYSENGYAYATSPQASVRSGNIKGKTTDNSKSDKAIRSLCMNLIDMGYIQLGKECNFTLTNKQLRVAGKQIKASDFERIKAEFEQKLGSSSNYAFTFAGVISKVSAESMEMHGSMSSSFGK